MGNPREAYGRALADLAAQDQRIWALDADLCRSTMSVYMELEHPDRYVEAGIAEANMVGMAAGLALCGKVPFVSTFAVFLSGRAYDQIRQSICLAGLSVKLCGSSAGLSDYGDGSTHQTVEDLSLMRALPGMTVLCPGDARQAASAVVAAARHPGPVYLRIGRSDTEDLPGDGTLEIGKMYPLREGSDSTIFATGAMVHPALQAARLAQESGVSALVVNVSTLKPLDGAAAVSLAGRTGLAISCEDHSVIGGLGAALSEVLNPHGIRLHRIGINDRFGQSSNSEAVLMEHYGLTARRIAERIVALAKEKEEAPT